MDEINEQTENMKQIQEALSTPIGAAADFDEVNSLVTPHIIIIFVQLMYLCLEIYKLLLFDNRMSLKQSLKS